jgi:hypothetical protein
LHSSPKMGLAKRDAGADARLRRAGPASFSTSDSANGYAGQAAVAGDGFRIADW